MLCLRYGGICFVPGACMTCVAAAGSGHSIHAWQAGTAFMPGVCSVEWGCAVCTPVSGVHYMWSGGVRCGVGVCGAEWRCAVCAPVSGVHSVPIACVVRAVLVSASQQGR
jgi:hypothetical protein